MQAQIHLIGRFTEISERELILRKTALNQRFQPPVMLHPLAQRVADEADVVALVELQRRSLRGYGTAAEESRGKHN